MLRRQLTEWAQSPTGRRRIIDVAVLTVIFAFVASAYAPSLKHPPRADQWCYLADTIRDHTFLETLRHSYSYNRTRQISPGDTDLFRPILFGLLAAEKAAFEGNLALTQGFGVVLHCATCALLLVLLRQIAGFVRPSNETGEGSAGRDALLYATVAFFALNPYVQELVIWGHLHGYVLFLVFLLGSVSCLLRYAADASNGTPAARYLCAGWVLALLAAFTYELGQFYAVLASAFIAGSVAPRAGMKRAICLLVAFVSIAVIYQTVNRIDQHVHREQYKPDNLQPLMVRQAFTRATVDHSARYGVYTGVQPFFPSLVQMSYTGQRLQIAETVWAGEKFEVLTPGLLGSLAVLGTAVALGVAGLWRLASDRARLPLLILLLTVGLYAAYGAMTVLGRMNMRPGPGTLSSNSYYAYTGLLFGLLAASVAWSAAGAWATRLRLGLAVGLVVLSAAGAEHVRETNATVARREKEQVRPLRAIQEFVDAHRHEPGFSFEIDYAASDPVPERYGVRTTLIMFSKWMSSPEPLYYIAVRDGKIWPVPRRSDPQP